MIKKLNKYKEFLTLGDVACAIGFIGLMAGVMIVSNDINSSENVQKKLEEKGYTQVVIGDLSFWCAKGDMIRRKFTAKDINGLEVEGKICAVGTGLSFFDRISTEPIKTNKVKF